MTPAEIYAFRKKRNISLMEIAAMTGLPQDYLERIEDGRVQASDTDLHRIVQALWRIEGNRNVPDDTPDE